MQYNKHKKRSHRNYRESVAAMQRFKNARIPGRAIRNGESFIGKMFFRRIRQSLGIKKAYTVE